MFEVGFSELLVIFVLALIVLGPEKLPRLAAQVGRWIGRARAMARQFREQLEEEVNVAEANKWKSNPSASPTPAPEPTPSAQASETTDAAATPTPHAHTEAATEHSSYETTHEGAADGSHASGPPAEPEAPVYQPPAYSSAPQSNGAHGEPATPAPSPPPAVSSDEAPLRPGDVVTTTHERGT
ncbi:MAG TPA: Sec-independent protein translocase protein TatB [Steroidobacteraceae bacterium]|jgi:sec-independent protein translocase protein TatB|nr:Sec-independent protein translocase protein TatB [Steroidobacteraceae bacterium]